MKFKVFWSGPKKFNTDNFEKLSDFEGVYMIGYRNVKTDKRYVVYVGQGLIKDRLEDHYYNNKCVKNRVFRNGGAAYYRYDEVSDEDDRLDIELGLYNKYGKDKLCNDQKPEGSERYDEDEIEVEEFFLND